MPDTSLSDLTILYAEDDEDNEDGGSHFHGSRENALVVNVKMLNDHGERKAGGFKHSGEIGRIKSIDDEKEDKPYARRFGY